MEFGFGKLFLMRAGSWFFDLLLWEAFSHVFGVWNLGKDLGLDQEHPMRGLAAHWFGFSLAFFCLRQENINASWLLGQVSCATPIRSCVDALSSHDMFFSWQFSTCRKGAPSWLGLILSPACLRYPHPCTTLRRQNVTLLHSSARLATAQNVEISCRKVNKIK